HPVELLEAADAARHRIDLDPFVAVDEGRPRNRNRRTREQLHVARARDVDGEHNGIADARGRRVEPGPHAERPDRTTEIRRATRLWRLDGNDDGAVRLQLV